MGHRCADATPLSSSYRGNFGLSKTAHRKAGDKTKMERSVSTRVVQANQENAREVKGRKKAGVKTDRVVLRPLQPNSKSQKPLDVKLQKGKDAICEKRTLMKSQGVQTDSAPSIDYDMCTSDEPPLEYWRVLAERRREALTETLEENEELHSENEALREKIAKLEKRLESKEYFTLMYQISCSDKDNN